MLRRALATLAVAAALPACSDVAAPRPQLLVVVDTDAPVPGQLVDPELSAAAAIDTLRIDVETQGDACNFRDFVVADPADWPVSFGVPAPDGDGAAYGDPVRLRIRAYRGFLARSETLCGENVLEPFPEATIERVIDVSFPDEDVRTVLVRLSLGCFARGSKFLGGVTTCLDEEHPDALPSEGLVDVAPDEVVPSQVGTSALARALPCEGAPSGTICVRGGLNLLGETGLSGLDGFNFLESRPLQAVLVSSFAMKRTEFTVRDFKDVMSGIEPDLLPDPTSPDKPGCTWPADLADSSQDDLPLNCVSHDAAAKACALAGGELPTEAQWEHAARGRSGRIYPWGEASPACCMASFGRFQDCQAPGVKPPQAGSHPRNDACGGLGDETPDGLLDLAGSLAEHVSDKAQNYDDPCWSGAGILRDPACDDPGVKQFIKRGGDYVSDGPRLRLTLRRSVSGADVSGQTDASRELDTGFRCVYPLSGGAP